MRWPTGNLRSILNAALHRCGFELVPTWLVASLPYRDHLKELLDTYGVRCVIDVGANEGQFGEFLRRQVGFNGTIESFEPAPASAKRLERRTRTDPRWFVHQIALGARDETRPLHVTQDDKFSSFLDPVRTERQPFQAHSAVIDQPVVAIRRLDSIAEEIGQLRNVRNVLLKLDTQGFDLEVVRGSGRVLDEVQVIQTEMSLIPIYEDAPSYHVAIEELESLGFEIAGFYPLSYDPHGRLIEFDCLMVRADCAGR